MGEILREFPFHQLGKEKTLSILAELLGRGEKIEEEGICAPGRDVWHKDVLSRMSMLFGEGSEQHRGVKVRFETTSYRRQPSTSEMNHDFRRGMGICLATIRSAYNFVDTFGDLQAEPAAPSVNGPAPVERVLHLFKRFCAVEQVLRKVRQDGADHRYPLIIRDEYDVQYLLHALLISAFDDVRPEEYGPSVGGSHARMDFLVPEGELVVEAKMTRAGLGNAKLVDELSSDFIRYGSHPLVKTVIVLVWDPSKIILNARGLERDLSKSYGSIDAIVRVHY